MTTNTYLDFYIIICYGTARVIQSKDEFKQGKELKRLVAFECYNHLDVIAPDQVQTCFLSRDIDATLEKYLVAISESCIKYAFYRVEIMTYGIL